MSEEKNVDTDLICINCPLGCKVFVKGDLTVPEELEIKGNTCIKGKEYAISELTAPKRMVTSSVMVLKGDKLVVSVKTKEAIPKNLIFDAMSEIRRAKIQAPVKIGDIVIGNLCNTGIKVVATSNVDRI